MTDDLIQGRWKHEAFRAQLRNTRGRLSDEDLARENADREFVIGKVQEYYGHSREHADELVRDFERSL